MDEAAAAVSAKKNEAQVDNNSSNTMTFNITSLGLSLNLFMRSAVFVDCRSFARYIIMEIENNQGFTMQMEYSS